MRERQRERESPTPFKGKHTVRYVAPLMGIWLPKRRGDGSRQGVLCDAAQPHAHERVQGRLGSWVRELLLQPPCFFLRVWGLGFRV